MPSPIPPTLHPLMVHGPLILIPLAALFATLAVRGRAWARPATMLVLALAALSALTAIGSGLYEWLPIESKHEGTQLGVDGERHEILGLATFFTTVGALAFAWRKRNVLFDAPWRWRFVIALWFIVILVFVTGWYGGSLVYEHGLKTPPPPP